MRILQVHNRYRQAGGEDVVVQHERRVLEDAGHSVETFTVENPTGLLSSTSRLLAAPWNLSSARSVRDVVRDFRPDLAHVHNTWFSLSPAAVSAIADEGIPVVMTLHNYRSTCINGDLLRDGSPCELCVGTSPWTGVRYSCYRGSFAQSIPAALTVKARLRPSFQASVRKYLVLTPFAKSLFTRSGIDPRKISVKPNFVADPGPRHSPPSASDLVLFVGRLNEQKGVDTIARAWSQAAPKGLRLLAIGSGPLADSLRELGPGVQVKAWQPREAIREAMLSARGLVFPSKSYEGQSMVVLEAMASGLAIVSSDWQPIRDTLQGADPSWSLPATDVSGWQDAIVMLGDDQKVDSFGNRLRRTYESMYTPTIGLANLEREYAAVLDA